METALARRASGQELNRLELRHLVGEVPDKRAQSGRDVGLLEKMLPALRIAPSAQEI